MQKKWNIKNFDQDKISEIKDKYNISDILAKLLMSREIEDIDKYLFIDLKNIQDPYKMYDMNKFVDRVEKAIKNKEKICIYGDYDVDGITSTVILYSFLKELNANVSYYLPDRLIDGYGVNISAIDKLKQDNVNLIITVDCGVTAIKETEYAKELGIDMCITDHHECSDDLPNAVCIVNPKQSRDTSSFKYHAGVGVAYKCLMALAIRFNLDSTSYLKYLDFVAIGTISDIVPLIDENRVIAKFGLQHLRTTKNLGLIALLKLVGKTEIDSNLISFSLAPRINACGRMGNANLAVELFLSKTITVASIIATKLDEINKERKEIEKNIFDLACKMIKKNETNKLSSIVLYNENWHNGVIGIVASRLVNMYYKPVILFTKEHSVIRGSGRCPNGFSLYDNLTKCSDLLIQFGGHDLASGLSIEYDKIDEFTLRFDELCKEVNLDNKEVLDIDCEIKREDLNINLIRDTVSIKPYGQNNKEPIFLYKNLIVQAMSTIKNGEHLRLTVRDANNVIVGIGFNMGNRRDEINIGDEIDMAIHININTITVPKTIGFIVKDFKKV